MNAEISATLRPPANNTLRAGIEAAAATKAVLNYVSAEGPAPRVYYIDPPAGEPLSTVGIDPHEVEIRDVRGFEHLFSLDKNGCCFPANEIGACDFDNPDEVRTQCYPAAEAMVLRLTNFTKVLAFDHGVRRRRHGLDSAGKPRLSGADRNVADFAHNDYTPYSSTLRVRWFAGDEAEQLLQGRYAIFNFWWPIRGPLRDYPLALCPAGSTNASDFREIENIFERGPNPIFGLNWNPAHRWFYKSALREDELLMFRTWDSGRPIEACCPHVAFTDPNAGDDVLPRESIELRVLAFSPS